MNWKWDKEHPQALRILVGAVAVLTILLIPGLRRFLLTPFVRSRVLMFLALNTVFSIPLLRDRLVPMALNTKEKL